MRAARLIAWFPSDPARAARLRRALTVLEPYAITDGAAVFTANTVEGFDDELDAFIAQGYKEERRSKSWELDLVVNRGQDPLAATQVRRPSEDDAEVAPLSAQAARRVVRGVGECLDGVEALGDAHRDSHSHR